MNNELTVSRSAGLSLAGERAHLGVEFTFRFGAALSWVLHKLAVRGQGAVVRTPKNQRGMLCTSVIRIKCIQIGVVTIKLFSSNRRFDSSALEVILKPGFQSCLY